MLRLKKIIQAKEWLNQIVSVLKSGGVPYPSTEHLLSSILETITHELSLNGSWDYSFKNGYTVVKKRKLTAPELQINFSL